MRFPESSVEDGTKLASGQLRVAIVTACLAGAGGAEKQTYYIARALAEAGVDVRVYTLRGGAYEDSLHQIRVESKRFGGLPGLPLRLILLLRALRGFRPHIIQSIHAYTNAYSAIAGKLLATISVGGLRGDLRAFFEDNGHFSHCLLTWPDAVAVNSKNALEQIKQVRLVDPARLHLLPNAIDLQGYPEREEVPLNESNAECTFITVSRLDALKRVDVFVRALAMARSAEPGLKAVVVGWGPEAPRLQQLVAELGLSPDAFTFLGFRGDVASLLQQSSGFVFCSESEGTPNAILEGMAASLPVITTAAGDAADVVESAGAGYVVPFGNAEAIADAMVRLARSPALRWQLGVAGRAYLARHRSIPELGGQLMKIYADVARTCERSRRDAVLDHIHGSRNAAVARRQS